MFHDYNHMTIVQWNIKQWCVLLFQVTRDNQIIFFQLNNFFFHDTWK